MTPVPIDPAGLGLRLEEALALALRRPLTCTPERVPLAAALGRTLAAPVHAAIDAPEQHTSAMDGYAVILSDLRDLSDLGGLGGPGAAPAPRWLRLHEVVAAGHPPQRPLLPGAVARVMTGAQLPIGAEAVVMQEHTRRDGDQIAFFEQPSRGQHIRRQGADHAAGDRLLPAGARLGPESLGLLASQGATELSVWARPRVAVLSTGDELAPPGGPRAPGQRWASNSLTLCALIEEAGGEAIDCGIAPDDRAAAARVVRAAMDLQPDLILSSGGVSVGDFDVMKDVFVALGASIDQWRVAMKPGKPLLIGELGGARLFGLPGNPLSSATTCRLFARSLIRASLGDPTPLLPILDVELSARIAHRPGRAELVPVLLAVTDHGLRATPQRITGSGSTAAGALGGGLALLGVDLGDAEAGDRVPVMLLSAPLGLGARLSDLRWGGRPLPASQAPA
jgi:molybdopterin molybdotransferase